MKTVSRIKAMNAGMYASSDVKIRIEMQSTDLTRIESLKASNRMHNLIVKTLIEDAPSVKIERI